MSSDIWLKHFEQLEAEHPELDDSRISELAEQAVRDEYADRVDAAMDEASEGDTR